MTNSDLNISNDLPVFQNLLKSLKDQAEIITKNINEISEEVKNGNRETSNGVSLLDVKYLTLSNYIMDILHIVNLKIKGQSIEGCEAVKRTVENRTVLEKICPLEQKMRYQIDKILQENDKTDPTLKFQANVDNFGSDSESGEETPAKSNKYIPPHIAAAHYLEEGEEKALKEKARQKALRKSSLLQELSQEHADAPLVLTEKTSVKSKILKQKEERQRYEEEYFTRVNLTKKEKNAEKRMVQRSELDTLTSFGASDVYVNKNTNSTNLKKRKNKRISGKSGGKKKKRVRM